jgi:hypothetical protein
VSYAVPLCTACHAKQHRVGELTFWSALRFDSLNVASRLWTVSFDLEAGELIVFRARQQINLAKPDGSGNAPYLQNSSSPLALINFAPSASVRLRSGR